MSGAASRPARGPAGEARGLDPAALAAHYSRFRVSERLLLTGHSHQAWPDVTYEAQRQAWRDAAEHVDQKWELAEERASRFRVGLAERLDDEGGLIALGQNTHELVIRLLSALPLGERPRLVTTDGEFHTICRQAARLAEEGIEVVVVPALPANTLAERLAATVDARTACVMVSAVLFENARIVPGLGALLVACEAVGATLLVDAYHALNATPFSIRREGLQGAFVVGGGYKYLQMGEGNCFLRFPEACTLRPVLTGWFSEFDVLQEAQGGEGVVYGAGPNRFAGATYDPTSHYRAAAVLDFFAEQGMTPEALRATSQHQLGVLIDAFDALDADPGVIDRDRDVGLAELGGFLALRSPRAAELSAELLAMGVSTDSRGDRLRFGPAPYLTDAQLVAAIGYLGELVG